MRKMKSFVALASTVAVMACQTAAASSAVMRQAPVPAAANASLSHSQNVAPAVTRSEAATAPLVADGTSHKKTWIIIGVVAAIVAVALIVSGSGGSSSVY